MPGHITGDFHSFRVSHDFFLKLPFLKSGDQVEISAVCGGVCFACCSFKTIYSTNIFWQNLKIWTKSLKNQKATESNSVFITLKNPRSIILRKSHAIRAWTHYMVWAILQYLVLWCLLSKGLFSRPKQFLILYSLLDFELQWNRFTELIY